jgi:hypothetical protein
MSTKDHPTLTPTTPYVLVPREPTEAMEAAAVHAAVNLAQGRPWFPFAWRAAIAAAPAAPAAPPVEHQTEQPQTVCTGSDPAPAICAAATAGEVGNGSSGEGVERPVAWMRDWAFAGIDVMAMPKRERPRGWNMKDVTVFKLLETDIPLCATASHEGTRTDAAEASSAQLASGETRAQDTLRGELEALAAQWQTEADHCLDETLWNVADILRAIIRKHYGAS